MTELFVFKHLMAIQHCWPSN